MRSRYYHQFADRPHDDLRRTRAVMRQESTGYCLGCKAQLSFCGKPFTAELVCRSCGAVNVYEESQQPARIKAT